MNPNYDLSIKFLKQFNPDGTWVLTAISLDKKTIETKTFHDDGDKQKALREWLERVGKDRNCYFSVNPCVGDMDKKPARENVKSLTWLHVDVDSRAGEDLAQEKQRIANLLEKPPAGIPKPTVTIFSGGGYQGFWRLKEPMAIGGQEALYKEAARYNQQLELDFGADECHNVDRIMRLPGTINRPDERKKKKGRVETLATVISFDESRVYDLGEFKQAPAQETESYRVEVDEANVLKVDDVYSIQGISDLCKQVIVQGDDLDAPIGSTGARFPSRSEAVFFVCCECCRAKLDDNTIYSILMDKDKGISKSITEKGRNASDYAKRQIERAREKVGRDFDREKNGRPKPTIANVRRALLLLGAELYYNEFSDHCIIEGLPDFGPILQDAAVDRLWLRCEEEFDLSINKDKFYTIVRDTARRNVRNPVVEYLDSLHWDEVRRNETWLIVYFGAPDTPYIRAVGPIFLRAAVKRARHPGCKFDEMLVLESEQGKDKSSALEALAVNSDWFTDTLDLSGDTKRQVEQTKGKWLVEAGELKGMRGAKVETLKCYLSRKVDGPVRMAWGHIEQEYPRRFVIAGSTNNTNYLEDETGNRRFWPVKVGKIDLEKLRTDRNQLWAEAAAEEAAGLSIRLDPSLYAAAAKEQAERHERHPWCDILERYLDDEQGKVSRETLWTVLGLEGIKPSGDSAGRSLSKAMQELGFTRGKDLYFPDLKRQVPGFWRGNKDRVIKTLTPSADGQTPTVDGKLTPDLERSCK